MSQRRHVQPGTVLTKPDGYYPNRHHFLEAIGENEAHPAQNRVLCQSRPRVERQIVPSAMLLGHGCHQAVLSHCTTRATTSPWQTACLVGPLLCAKFLQKVDRIFKVRTQRNHPQICAVFEPAVTIVNKEFHPGTDRVFCVVCHTMIRS